MCFKRTTFNTEDPNSNNYTSTWDQSLLFSPEQHGGYGTKKDEDESLKKPLTSRDYKLRSVQTMCPVLRSAYLVLGLLLMVTESLDAFSIHAKDDQGDSLTITLNPSNITDLLYTQSVDIYMMYNYTGTQNIGLKIKSHDKSIAEVKNQLSMDQNNIQYYSIRRDNKDFLNQSIRIDGIFLGRTYLEFFTNISLFNATSSGPSAKERPTKSENWFRINGAKFQVAVIREDGPLNTTFTATIIILVVLSNVAMGCKVDLKTVKETMKRPVAPCIGLFSQFIIMPILGFAVSQMFNFDPIIALALLATGCAPGGGASNTYTFLMGGNVSLSVTMTLISTLASLAMIPLWLFTLGSLYVYRDAPFHIPYKNILISLIGLIIPVVIGLTIQRKRPSWVKNILKAILPLMIILIVLILSVGIYANMYIFQVFQPKVIAAGALLPNAGFILGGLLAIIFMQPWTDIKTIAIETGLQNTGVPIVLLLSLPKPESDLAIVAPVAAALFTPIILWVFITVRMIRNRFCRDRKSENLATVKCQHTNPENEKFVDNIPCRRTEKIPPDCPADKMLPHTEEMNGNLHYCPAPNGVLKIDMEKNGLVKHEENDLQVSRI